MALLEGSRMCTPMRTTSCRRWTTETRRPSQEAVLHYEARPFRQKLHSRALSALFAS